MKPDDQSACGGDIRLLQSGRLRSFRDEGDEPEAADAVTIVGEVHWNNRLTVVARIATTAMPRYDAIDLA